MDISSIALYKSPKSHLIYHEDPSSLHIGTMPDHAWFIPFEKGSCPFGRKTDSSRVELLNGDWKFNFYESIIDLEDDFLSVDFPKTIPVPGMWQLNGYDRAQYTNVVYPFPFDPPYMPDDIPTGVYKTTYNYTPDGMDKILTFEGVDSCLYLCINGKFAGYTQVSHSISEFDITPFLKAGSNSIACVVLKWCDGSYLEDQDKFRLTGIFRDVYVTSRPKKRIDDFRIISDMDGSLTVTLMGCGAALTLRDPEGNIVLAADAVMGKNTYKIDNPILWTAETPALYSLTLETEDEIIGEKVGFRSVYIENGVLKLNGKHIKLHGVNRHDSYPDTGYVASEERMYEDLCIMKRHNMNALRTSHYPNAPMLYRFADELGLYVVAEADYEAHGCVDAYNSFKWEHGYNAIAIISGDERFKESIIDRERKNVFQQYNHPSVIMWSMGNEAGWGSNTYEAAKLIKEWDSSRILHYESTHRMDDTPTDIIDVVSKMYFAPFDMHWIIDDENEKRPFFQCEYSHAMGNSNGDLEDYQQVFYSSDRYAGGCIWEFCDHALVQGVADNGKTKYGYGGDFGERHNDGNFCVDAVVYPDRTPHVGLLEAKQVFRPVRVTKSEGCEFVFESFLVFAKAEELLDCTYEINNMGKVVASGKVDFSVAPRSKSAVTVHGANSVHGESIAIRFIFTAKQDMPYRKAGDIVCFDQIILSEKASTAAIPTGEAPAVMERPLEYAISAGNLVIRFDRRHGRITSIQKSGREVLARPIEWNFFRAPTDNDSPRGEWYRAHLNCPDTKVYSTDVKVTDNAAIITVEHSFGWNILDPFCKAATKITVYGDGTINVHTDGKTSNKVNLLPRFGLRIFAKREFDNVTYYGYGPYESYMDKHHASHLGLFSAKVADMHEDYIKPQENSSHWNTRFLTVENDTDEEAPAICIKAPKNFSFNVSQYTQEELSAKRHNYELEPCGDTVICVDSGMCGVGSNSCGPALDNMYRISLPEISLDFTVTVE